MNKKDRTVTVTVEVERDGMKYIRVIRSTPTSLLAYLMRDISIAGREIRQDILADRVAKRKRNIS